MSSGTTAMARVAGAARLAACLLALLGAPRALAGYRESFKLGMDAFDRKRWEEVVRHMRAAATEQPEEGERVKLYGLRFEAYYPHFYMGYAYVQLGRCAEARKALHVSQSQGAIRGSARYAELVDGLKSCEAPAVVTQPTPAAGPDVAALARAERDAESALARAEEAARALAPLSSDAALAALWPREAALGPAENAARETLAGARGRLDAGRRAADLALLGEAREQATRATERLEAVLQAAQRRRDELRAAAVATTTPPPATTVAPPSATGVTPPGTAAPQAALHQGAQAYFDGRYDDALRALRTLATPPRGRFAAQAALLRAAARFALYRAGGARDVDLRGAAAADVAACRRADPTLLPDPGTFSPAFVAFFRSPE